MSAGYGKENVKIEINEDGTQIIVNGEKPVQEIVMVGWRACKKEIATRRFRRGFKIPDGVVLDKIKAWFDKEESILTIKMPKLVKGFQGIRVEEVIEEEHVGRTNGGVDNERIETSPIAQADGKKTDAEGVKGSDGQAAEDKLPAADEIAPVEGEIQGQESGKEDKPQELDEDETSRRKQLEDKYGKEIKGKEEVSGESREREEERSHVNQADEASSEICGPIIIGSVFLVSVIVFVIHLFRTRNPPTKRKN